MNTDNHDKSILVRADAYFGEREKLLSLPPEKILDAILDHPRAGDLVRSFPEEDFYFLIHDIGPADSLELLSMASETQWEYVVDLESWRQDRVDFSALTKWFDLLLQADPGRLVQWLLKDKLDLVELYLVKNIQVIIREHDQDPADFGKDFFTFDDVYYLRIIDKEDGPAQTPDEKTHSDVLSALLKRLAEFDHVKFQHVLLESGSLIPAETEEEAYRLRNVRLAEKGFLPFDEALGIYQHLDRQVLQTRHRPEAAGEPEGTDSLPVPLYPSKLISGKNLFSASLQVIDSSGVLQQIQMELAALCNQIIMADQKKIHDRESLRSVVRKACGYLSIGLGRLLDLKKMPPEQQKKISALNLTRFSLVELFRVGYGSALELKWRADKWLQKSWFKAAGLPLSFWGEAWTGVLGGLLLKRPLFYDNYKTGVLYRDFSSGKDISQTGRDIEAIMAFDDLLERLNLTFKSVNANTTLNHKNLVLTLWAGNYLGHPKVLRPLALDEFKNFFSALWIDVQPPRRIRQAMKTSFLDWLSGETGISPGEIGAGLGSRFDELFIEIESEYGHVSEADLDPKYIHLFLLSAY